MARAPKKIIAKKDDTPHETPVVLHTIKGFERDLSCRGFKFEVGKSYSVSGEIECCSNGFHACENPLDVLSHYPASTSVFHEVEQSGEIARHDVDSKIASATITIGVEISLNDLIARGVKWIFDKVDFMNAPATNTGYRSAATNTGDHSAASVEGKASVAVSIGVGGKARGSLGCAICLVHRNENTGEITAIRASKVGENGVKPDAWYSLNACGEFVEESE